MIGSQRQSRHESEKRLALRLMFVVMALAISSCSHDSGGSSGPSSRAVDAYCPLTTNPAAFPQSISVSGSAYYQYRVNGNGIVSDGVHTLTPASGVLTNVYSVTINGTAFSWTCNTTPCTTNAVTNLKAAINAAVTANGSPSLQLTASGTSTLILTPTTGPLTLTSLAKLSDSANADPRPVRYAEVRATAASGAIVQCAETDANGSFTMSLPADNNAYTISVAARSNNSLSSVYVMNNPTDNNFYQLSQSITASGSIANLSYVAKATDTLEGGAFNILDQLLNAQNYLRSSTASCNVGASTHYFPDCDPYLQSPLIYVYWTPGVSPGKYFGISGPISFYLSNKANRNSPPQLYLLGGINGDTDKSDMDQFDNSVIIHEYGHFIEDQFGDPNSPGGSHSGNAIIDARLAWGEGWGDFFQAAVTGNPVYRDTYGHVGCTPSGTSPCVGATFNESLVLAQANYDIPEASSPGEGNFREFSVARLMWEVVKPSGTSQFSELWTVLHGPARGMKAVGDPFKSIGRVHAIQSAISGGTNWSTIRNNEEHSVGFTDYATPLSTAAGCSPTSVAMPIRMTSYDSGNFASSDQLRNNDFYVYQHGGGSLNISMSWTGSNKADLDLYLYKTGYTFGTSSAMVLADQTQNPGNSGAASMSGNVAAGTYMINVMAYTGVYFDANSNAQTGNYPTNYTLTINGRTACPAP